MKFLLQKLYNKELLAFEYADKKNKDLSDDDKFIYISVDDFINAREITAAKDFYNKETRKLINNPK